MREQKMEELHHQEERMMSSEREHKLMLMEM